MCQGGTVGEQKKQPYSCLISTPQGVCGQHYALATLPPGQSCYPFQYVLNTGYNEKDMKGTVNTKFLGLQTDTWKMFWSQNDDSHQQYCHTSNYFTNFHSTIKYTVMWAVICPVQTGHVLHIIKLLELWMVQNLEISCTSRYMNYTSPHPHADIFHY